MRQKVESAMFRFDHIGRRCSCSHPAGVGRIESLVPHSERNVLNLADGTIIEIENGKDLAISAPSPYCKDARWAAYRERARRVLTGWPWRVV